MKLFIHICIALSLMASFTGCAGIKADHHANDYRTDAPKGKNALNIQNLHDLTYASIEELRKNVGIREVYIIVHPSYYIFFDKKPFRVRPDKTKNAVQSFLNTEFRDSESVIHLLKDYEREEMKLFTSSQKNERIIILVLPGRYGQSKQYLYKNGHDEYARYLNDATRDSASVFYIESKNASSGKISEFDKSVLIDFLKKLGVKKVLIGGGYVGRCQEEFYKMLSESWNEEDMAIIPEISAFSPNDITDSTAKMLLTADRKINPRAAKYFIKNGGLETLGKKLNVKISSP